MLEGNAALAAVELAAVERDACVEEADEHLDHTRRRRCVVCGLTIATATATTTATTSATARTCSNSS